MRKQQRWRRGVPLVFVLCGVLLVLSAVNSDRTSLRPSGYTDLASLVQNESRLVDDLTSRVARLDREVTRLSEQVGEPGAERYSGEIERLDDPAGLTGRSGPGVRVTLSDAPEKVIENADEDVNINLLVVHQQDIQAVVNAMWRAGAEAVTVQGQRVVSTTGIRCEGNSVLLQGVPYPEPYVIEAVGDQTELVDELTSDEYLRVYREQAASEEISIGWDLQLREEVETPAYDGVLSLEQATPID